MFATHTEPLAILKTAMREVEEAREYFDRAEGREQIDEAAIRLTAAEMTANRLVRQMKRERGLRAHEYKCPFEQEDHSVPCELI